MNEPAVEVALFDLGGVLVELTGVPTLLSWMGGRVDADEVWRHWLTSPSVRAFETGGMGPEDFAEQLVAELELPVPPEEFLSAFTSWPRGLFPGAMELVCDIPRSITRASLSNTNDLHWPRLMDEMALEGLFDFHFASHLTGKIKPDDEAFEHVISSIGCAPESILFVDDNQLNVDAATALGISAFRAKGVEEARAVMDRNGALDT